MTLHSKKPASRDGASRRDDALELETLLHPAQAFAHPLDVVRDPDLTLNEKRAILSSWASDACAVEAAPPLRRVPGSGHTVQFDEIIDALRSLDRQVRDGPMPHYRRVLADRKPGVFGRSSQEPTTGGQDSSLN
jgi:hypothetical protein